MNRYVFSKKVAKDRLVHHIKCENIECNKGNINQMYDALFKEKQHILENLYKEYKYAGATSLNIYEIVGFPQNLNNKKSFLTHIKRKLGINTNILNAPLNPKLSEVPQIYLIEETEKSDLANATERFEKLKNIFSNRVGLIHGRLKNDEKDSIMQSFINHEIDILVSTTVIEVGVDVPTANIMIIEQAERFGLSQLHQLRGRIGRGKEKSTCLLLHGPKLSETAKNRLNVMRQTSNGFEIAEADLKLRGAGDILGTRQSGLENLKFADLSLHQNLLEDARNQAKELLKADPALSSDIGKNILILLYLFQKDVSIHTLKAG